MDKLDITPGEWHWYDSFGRREGKGLPTATGEHILGIEKAVGNSSHNSLVIADDQGFVIARCTNALVTMSGERSEANAKLMAKAPRLLWALLHIGDQCEGEVPDYQDAVDRLSEINGFVVGALQELGIDPEDTRLVDYDKKEHLH